MQNCLELTPNPQQFEPTTPDCVFFDDGHHQIIALRPGKMTGLILRRDDKHETTTTALCLDLPDHQTVIAIKFSLDHKLMAVQRTDKCIEVYRFDAARPERNTLLTKKLFCGSNFKVSGFVWVSSVEILVVTNRRMELFRLAPDTKELITVKKVDKLDIDWHAWCKVSHLVVVGTIKGKPLTPFVVKYGGFIEKLTPLMIDAAADQTNVTFTNLYGVGTILYFKHAGSEESEIVLYQIDATSSCFIKTHVLQLDVASANVKIQIVDNVIVTHDTDYHESKLFDIGLECEVRNGISYQSPISKQRTLSQYQLEHKFDYSKSIFYPRSVIVVPSEGRLWYTQLNLQQICLTISEPVKLVDILLQRAHSKRYVLEFLRLLLSKFSICDHASIITIFDRLCGIHKKNLCHVEKCFTGCSSSNTFVKSTSVTKTLFDQNDMLTEVLTQIDDLKQRKYALLIYLDALASHGIPAESPLSCFAIETMVRSGNVAVLDQLLQQETIKNSQSVVNALMSFYADEKKPIFLQLAMDVLVRMGADEKAFQVLTDREKVMEAILLAIKLKKTQSLDEAKCLAAAKRCPVLQHSVEMFFIENKS